MSSLLKQTLWTLVALAAALTAWPGPAKAEDGRKDVTIGNPDRQRAGVNEQGDNEMVIERKPKRKQDMPDLGPMYVVPQVNTGRGQVPVILPVPQQPGPQGPPPPPPPRDQPGPRP